MDELKETVEKIVDNVVDTTGDVLRNHGVLIVVALVGYLLYKKLRKQR